MQTPLRSSDSFGFLQGQQVFSSVFVGSLRLHSRFLFAMPLFISILLKKTPSFSSWYDGGVGLGSLVFEERYFKRKDQRFLHFTICATYGWAGVIASLFMAFIGSWNHLVWKSLLRSWIPIINLMLPSPSRLCSTSAISLHQNCDLIFKDGSEDLAYAHHECGRHS